MPDFEEARRLVLESVVTLGSEMVPILESLGRVIAQDVAAPWDMPLCDNSAMDGYAVRCVDCAEPGARLRITGFIPAGSKTLPPVEPGCAVKIMTGAPIPSGCDTVVPFEDAEPCGLEVRIRKSISSHQHIRFAGGDVRCGEVVISRGTVLRPAEISMLLSCGKSLVSLHRRPTVAILSTGDELIEAGEPIAPGKVIDSNSVSLAAAARQCGATPVLVGTARDTRASHVEKMTEGLRADVFVTSAGVSAGERDLVRKVLAELGVREVFSQVDMRPGAPTCFGIKDRTAVFSLPGNPVASLIAFEELVRPALLKMMGHRRVLKRPIHAILQGKVSKKPGKLRFLRVRLEMVEGKCLAYSAGDQNTGVLKTLLMADGLAILPAERTSFSPGDEVQVHPLSEEAGMIEPPAGSDHVVHAEEK